ncbi:MAG: Transposase family, partial [Planctomycetota bacterium]
MNPRGILASCWLSTKPGEGHHGVEIPESTLCDWVKDAAEILDPIVCAMRSSVLESAVVQS